MHLLVLNLGIRRLERIEARMTEIETLVRTVAQGAGAAGFLSGGRSALQSRSQKEIVS